MLTPYEFFKRFYEVCGKDAYFVWSTLSEDDVQMLVEDDDKDAWQALECFREIIMITDYPVPKAHDMPLPEFNCRSCQHLIAVAGSQSLCSKSLKPLPIKNICKYFAI